MKELEAWIEELPESYPFIQTRELDRCVRSLGRGWISRDSFEDVSPSTEKKDITESLKRLYNRGYLTDEEIQKTIGLFGGWK